MLIHLSFNPIITIYFSINRYYKRDFKRLIPEFTIYLFNNITIGNMVGCYGFIFYCDFFKKRYTKKYFNDVK